MHYMPSIDVTSRAVIPQDFTRGRMEARFEWLQALREGSTKPFLREDELHPVELGTKSIERATSHASLRGPNEL